MSVTFTGNFDTDIAVSSIADTGTDLPGNRTFSPAARQSGHGRNADSPSEIPLHGWWDVAKRVWVKVEEDRIMLVAAGVTFYLLLALFPALTAFVSVYGFVADPRTIADHIAFLGGVLPSGGIEIIQSQLNALVSQDQEALSIGFLAGLVLALWSANKGVKALFDGLNVAYEEREKRGFFMLNITSGLFTLGAILIGIFFIVSVGVVPVILAFARLDAWSEILVSLVRWPLMFAAIATGIMLIYRYGPSRERAKWRWLTWGALLATVVWAAASVGFSYYLQNFADYNATYGSLGAIIGFMVWTWLSVTILLLGAELNAEMEHQTARDTTTGPDEPMGERGAVVADTLGR
ncbi:ribonuclease [Agaricicola taiwanensis]|uniref:Ribonuclease n=1 Tax=Agaricicola taiwanensis TaxID=591372 RepID=A0A8J2YLL1_9RHOB|nr:YihY/virulence factor BrkB family protein [Agaricicola taiwanensis]GGE52686.1 ribonuclease [Agaricicola taiwanensis]